MAVKYHDHQELGCEERYCKYCDMLRYSCQFYPKSRIQCKLCVRAKNKEWERENRTKGNPKFRTSARLEKYGLTYEQYVNMCAAQGGKCAICKRVPVGNGNMSVLQVDHDHVTGKVRGLLCQHCNTGLGKFGDRVDVLIAAVQYLVSNGGGDQS